MQRANIGICSRFRERDPEARHPWAPVPIRCDPAVQLRRTRMHAVTHRSNRRVQHSVASVVTFLKAEADQRPVPNVIVCGVTGSWFVHSASRPHESQSYRSGTASPRAFVNPQRSLLPRRSPPSPHLPNGGALNFLSGPYPRLPAVSLTLWPPIIAILLAERKFRRRFQHMHYTGHIFVNQANQLVISAQRKLHGKRLALH